MNDIKETFSAVYGNILKGGYLYIDESIVDWSSRHKLLPIKLMLADSITTDMQGGDLIEKSYEETPLLCVTYNNAFTIWETLIRKGLLEGTVEITNNQLDRICNPVLGDRNNNLLHHMSESHRFKELEMVFNKTNLKNFVKTKSKRFPIFLNFDNKSPLDLAIDQFDFESFQLLLRTAIEF